jgi:hypothetical protein
MLDKDVVMTGVGSREHGKSSKQDRDLVERPAWEALADHHRDHAVEIDAGRNCLTSS